MACPRRPRALLAADSPWFTNYPLSAATRVVIAPDRRGLATLYKSEWEN